MTPELEQALRKSKERWDLMTPEQRDDERKAQRGSFVRAGAIPVLTPEQEAERINKYLRSETANGPYRWSEEGPPPRRWFTNGACVYRTFEDCVDD